MCRSPLVDQAKVSTQAADWILDSLVSTVFIVTPNSGFGHLLTNSRPFQAMARKAFDICDADGSGAIDQSELYSGMLLIHLNLAKYAGPAACYPPSRAVCQNLYHAADWDRNGTIDRTEFARIMGVLCAQILQRMLIYYTILILLVPVLAAKVVGVFHIDNGSSWALAANQTISMSLFFLAIPLIWNKIDESSERRLKKQTKSPKAHMDTLSPV